MKQREKEILGRTRFSVSLANARIAHCLVGWFNLNYSFFSLFLINLYYSIFIPYYSILIFIIPYYSLVSGNHRRENRLFSMPSPTHTPKWEIIRSQRLNRTRALLTTLLIVRAKGRIL
jgi:hypothetical protein